MYSLVLTSLGIHSSTQNPLDLSKSLLYFWAKTTTSQLSLHKPSTLPNHHTPLNPAYQPYQKISGDGDNPPHQKNANNSLRNTQT